MRERIVYLPNGEHVRYTWTGHGWISDEPNDYTPEEAEESAQMRKLEAESFGPRTHQEKA